MRRDDNAQVTSVRPRGRPRVEERMEPVTTRLPVGEYDRLVRAANLQDIHVSALVRRLLILRLPPE